MMRKWVCCHLCGCTGYHREPLTNQEYPCPNGCEGGRVYQDTNAEWFARLVSTGAVVHVDEAQPGPSREALAI